MNKTLKLMLIILVIALLIRSYKIKEKEFGTDEEWSITNTNEILEGTFFKNAEKHGHTPFFFMMLAPFWALSNHSILFLRVLVIFFGLISIFITFMLSRKMFNANIGLLAAFLLAISPFHIMYSQHIRPYIFLMMASLIAILLFIKYLEKEDKKVLSMLTIINIVMFYIHMFAAFFVVSQFISLFILKFSKVVKLKIKPIVISGIAICIGWLPWLPLFLKQYSHNVGNIVTLAKLNPLHIPYTFYKYAVAIDFSSVIENYTYIVVFAAVLCVIVLYACYNVFRESKTKFVIMLSHLFLPTILLALLGIFFPIFSFRYVSYLQPIFIVMLAKGFAGIKHKKLRIILIVLTIIIWLIITKMYWVEFIKYKWGQNFAL